MQDTHRCPICDPQYDLPLDQLRDMGRVNRILLVAAAFGVVVFLGLLLLTAGGLPQ
jgi:hypothetical protein